MFLFRFINQPKNVSAPNKTPKWQYNGINATDGSDAGFMLNTDFELFYNVTLVTKFWNFLFITGPLAW